MNNYFDKKYLFTCLGRLLFVVVAMNVTDGAGFLFVIPLFFIAYSKNKNEDMLFWLMVTIAMVCACAQLVPKGAVFAYSQRILMVIMGIMLSVQLAGRHTSKFVKPILGLIPYLLFEAISSITGWCPIVSYLKLFLFVCVLLAYLGIANKVIISKRTSTLKIRSVALSFACFFILGSVILIPFPRYSIMLMDRFDNVADLPISLFQGIANHSQSLGPLLAMLSTMLFADLIFSVKKKSKLYILLLLCCPYLIYKTASRTAMGAMIAGFMIAVYVMMNAQGINRAWRGRVISIMLGLIALAVLVFLALPSGREGLNKYAKKYNNDDASAVTMTEVLSTRQGKWDDCIYNFKKRPMFGNGFQVSEDMIGREIAIRNVLTAPVEKSVWVSAVLEEGGAIGFGLFLVFVISTIMTFNKLRMYISLVTFSALLIINLGEFVLFSMSGVGGILWLVVVMSIVLDGERIKSMASNMDQKPIYM